MIPEAMERQASSVADLALGGIGWNLWRVLAESGARLLIGIILARLLLPSDFGLLAIIMLINGIAGLAFSGGLWASIIQYRELKEDDIRVAITSSLILGILGFFIIWLIAPKFSAFFGLEGKALLLRLAALEIIFSGCGAVVRSLRINRFDMKVVFFSEALGQIFGYGLFSILLALQGAGAWSLVIGNLARAVLSFMFLLGAERPPLRPLLRISSLKNLFMFGWPVTAGSLINTAAVKIDTLIIGRFLSPTDLGLYSRAFNLMQIPHGLITRITSGILFSFMAEIRADKQRLAKAYLAAITFATLACFPLLLAMGAVADLVVVGLYGPNWEGSVGIFRVLFAAGLFKTLLSVAGSAVKALGLVRREVIRQAAYLAILLAGGLIGVRFGTKGVSAAVMVGAAWSYWSVSLLVNSRLDIGWKGLLLAQAPGLLVGILVAGAAWSSSLLCSAFMPEGGTTVHLALVTLASLLVYAASLLIVPFGSKEDLVRLLRMRLSTSQRQ
jgi:PST family polysaccharide transporter